jgi:hypothetical protein
MSTTAPQQANGQPAAEQIRLPGAPPPPEAPKSHRRTVIIGAICALALAGLAVAGVLLLNKNHTTAVRGPSPSQVYQAKLTAVLTPLVASNVTLSSALQGVDGSKPTLRTASDAVKASQQQTVAARGAVAVLVAPAADQQLGQQATQALTQEAGYLSALSTTLGDPTSSASGSVQPLASAVSSAFVPLASVAPGGSASVSGVDNLQAWVSGANAAAKRHTPPPVVNNNTTVVNPPVVVTPPSGVQTAPDGGGSTDLYAVDSNISATTGVSSGLASNVFYDYWSHGGAGSESYSSWSPATQQYYDISASSDGSTVTAYVSGTSDPSARVVFSQKSINDYTQADADRFLASGNHR